MKSTMKPKHAHKGADKTPYVPQRDKVKLELDIYERTDLTEKQKSFLEIALDKNTQIMFVSGPAGTSKAQPLDTDILGKHGWVKMGNISVGDEIYGEDGKLHKVLSLHPQGTKDVYKVTFSDKTSTECTLDHLWFTQTTKDRNHKKHVRYEGKRRIWIKHPLSGTVKTTQEILDTLVARDGTPHKRWNHSIPLTSPIEFQSNQHIISPYVMGILLGDGCFRRNSGVTFSSADQEIIDRVSKEIDEKMEVHYILKCDYSIVHKNRKDARDSGGNSIELELRRLGLFGNKSEHKFIPDEYLFDSIENRIELLRGLLDSDGHIYGHTGSTYFTTASERLEQGVRFLVESLGGTCSTSIRENYYTYKGEYKKGLNSYSMCISLPNNIIPFHLSRKRNKIIPKTKYVPVRYIVGVELVGKKECQCILVDNPSHLYLTNNFIVTHNTFLTIYAGLLLLNAKRVSDILYVRSAVESADAKLGFLPGEANDKMAPYIQPLLDKLEELLPKKDIEHLIKDQRVSGLPVGFLRGLSWNAKVIISDENQNLSKKELVTLMTRLGQFSKMFILGDPYQSDINGKSGFLSMFNLFNDETSRKNGIYCFEFTKEDIVRSGLIKYILEKIESAPAK